MEKSPLASKTLWANAISILAMLVQSQTGFVVPVEDQAILLGGINLVLRFITGSPISWKSGSKTTGILPFLALLTILSGGLLIGCAGSQSAQIMDAHPALTELSIRAAVGRVLEEKPEWAKPAVSIIDVVEKSIASDGKITLGGLEALVVKEIPWDQVTPEEGELLKVLIRAVIEETGRYMAQQGVTAPEDAAVRVKAVLGWIRESAAIRAARAGA